MKFEKLKPGMFLVSTVRLRGWLLIKDKQRNKIIVDNYWTGPSGRFYKIYNMELKEYEWNISYKLGTTKDAQDLIVALFYEGLIK